MALLDLHVHTTCSDGLLTREQLLTLASQEGIQILSFTDHNYSRESPEIKAQAEEKGIILIDGVEISAQFLQHEVHLLGYGMAALPPLFEEYSNYYTETKTRQTQARCRRSLEEPLILASGQPLSVSFEELCQLKIDPSRLAPGDIPSGLELNLIEREGARLWNDLIYLLPQKYNPLKRPEDPFMTFYDAQGLLVGIPRAYEKFKDAFLNLEKGKRLWYSHYPFEYLPAGEVISLIQQAGGFSCLAHPGEQKLGKKTITELREIGLDALEVFTPKNPPSVYSPIAESLGLWPSGGTDFHYPSSHHRLGRLLKDRRLEQPTLDDFFPLTSDQATFVQKLLSPRSFQHKLF